MKTIVLDTNVYLSAIIFGGNPRHILDLVIEKKVINITSPEILLEISNKLKEKFNWSKEQIEITIKNIALYSKVVYPKNKINIVKKDKNDNKIIEAAFEGKAEFIISGDKHLLNLKKYQKTRIISPADFVTFISN